MSKYVVTIDKNLAELYHHGIKNQKWGRRRFQNEDGSLTEAGRKRYGVGDGDGDDSRALPSGSQKTLPSGDSNKSIAPYTKLAKRDNQDNEDDASSKNESFKPGDDGYEIHDAPKSNSNSRDVSKSKPEDIYDAPFEDKTPGKKQSSGKTKTEKEAEEAHKRAEERKKEAEKNRKEEEAEKKKNAAEREKNKKEREKEEEEAHERGEERKKEAEKNRKEEEAEKIKNLAIAKASTKDASKIAEEMANIAGRKKVNIPRMNLKDLTNDQMQKAIQREILEKQYDSMFNTSRNRAEANRERTKTFFQNVGSALTITGSALGIALTIKQLRK